MNFVKKRLSSSPAAWKVMANQVMVMPTIYPGGDYIGFDRGRATRASGTSCCSTCAARRSRTWCS